MSINELREIVDNGLNKLEMRINPQIKNYIINFSQGFPHYTHLLTKYAAKSALYMDKNLINQDHFDKAITEAIDNASESIRNSYQKAVLTTRKQSMFELVFSACALVNEDEHGTFRAKDLEAPLSQLIGNRIKLQAYAYHLGKLCQEERGAVLQKVGLSKQHRYRFKNPLLKAFITLKLYQTRKLVAASWHV